MCVVSMVIDWKYQDWDRRYPTAPFYPVPLPTPHEIEEFRKLLDRAREYDKRMNQSDCESEEKRQKLLAIAKELGINISFV